MPRKKLIQTATGFTFTVKGQPATKFPDILSAHVALGRYAEQHKLDVHVHQGCWEGLAMSCAFPKGGDMFLDLTALVRKG